MIQHQFYGGQDITIVPIFDVHLGSPNCMEQEFIKFIRQVKETPNVYLVLGGDLIENGTRNSVGSSVFEQKMSPLEQKIEMANILSEVADRCLCFVPGNHEARSLRDSYDCPVYDIAAKLNLENLYRPNIAFVKIQLGKNKTLNGKTPAGDNRPTYVLAVTHGSGNGSMTGSSLNKNERFGYAFSGTMDALIVGHSHKPVTSQPGKIHIDAHNNKVSIKPFKVLTATSWLEYGGYAAKAMLLPTTHCLNTLILRGNKKELAVTM